uniref:Uncharacterized protein n=1 Tax=Anguilla anguilla TaxID=7936 RepID=A0A0E9S756_ANGAN
MICGNFFMVRNWEVGRFLSSVKLLTSLLINLTVWSDG